MGEREKNILLLEDNAADAELIERELRRAGLQFRMQRVETKEAFEKALSSLAPNIVLSDYNLPGYDGLAALKVTRERYPDLPFIFVSGAIGEERAVETLTAGATDYVLKDRLQRLGAAVKRALEETETHAERQRLEKEILEIPIREQLRIGRDLHDIIGQELTAIAFMAKVLEQNLNDAGSPSAADARRIAEQVRESIQKVRGLVRGLCPVEMNEEGLMSALAGLAENVRGLFHVECRFECPALVLLRDVRRATELYYIAQEAVNNTLKHAKASVITIRLSATAERLVLNIRDNGRGLPPQRAKERGMGLGLMGYRARLIGGHLEIGRAPEGGVEITCIAPLNGK